MTTSLMSKVANALSFAHLAGLGAARPAAETPPEDSPKKDDDDEPKAEDDKEKRPGETADEYAARVEGMPDDKDEDGEKDKEKMAAAEAKGYAAGFVAQRERGAAIFASPAAARNVAMAAEFAFTTELSAERCIALLQKAPAAGASRPDRAGRNPTVGANAPAAHSPQAAAAARWDAHLQAARPKPRR